MRRWGRELWASFWGSGSPVFGFGTANKIDNCECLSIDCVQRIGEIVVHMKAAGFESFLGGVVVSC